MDVRTAQTELAHDVDAPRVGRRFVTSVLAGWGIAHSCVERAQLLVSEIVSNAVLHGGGPVTLRVIEVESGSTVRVEVDDHGGGQPQMRHAAPEDLSGRGLRLVDELARGWGSSKVGGGTSVWFEVQADASV